jgi:hypothetical protein
MAGRARRGRALAVRTSEGNGTAAAPCSATKSVSSIICAVRPFGTGRSPRVHLEPSLGSTPSKYESRYGVSRRAQAAGEVPQATWTGFYHANGLPGDQRIRARSMATILTTDKLTICRDREFAVPDDWFD